jgi:hypothetical protein
MTYPTTWRLIVRINQNMQTYIKLEHLFFMKHVRQLDDVNITTPKKLQYGTDVVKPRFTRKKLIVVGCVLMTELCERLTYYSVVANLILFCTSTLDISSTDAARINTTWRLIVRINQNMQTYIKLEHLFFMKHVRQSTE